MQKYVDPSNKHYAFLGGLRYADAHLPTQLNGALIHDIGAPNHGHAATSWPRDVRLVFLILFKK